MALIRFTVKATMVGGVVYYTCQEGLWSKSEETAKLYEKLYNNIAPYVKHNVSPEIIYEVNRLPNVDCMINCSKSYWNKGVMTSMRFISNLPNHVCDGATNLSETIQKYFKEQSQ
ncbi:MICOS complex subunit MIC13 homolog QIL1 [Lasioglossum baleicum]|uniref:MICOS complex subunit MIC13 homolog QIL1 n=1 Tax=Lasioglossum baleicum TaxID=434251 RepID=UPI003FCCE730